MASNQNTLLDKTQMSLYCSPMEESIKSDVYQKVMQEFPDIHRRFLDFLEDYQLTDEVFYESQHLTSEHIDNILSQMKMGTRSAKHRLIKTLLESELLGFGPLDKLLADDCVTDVLVNRFDEVFVEYNGQLQLSSVRFYDDRHLMTIIHRILSFTNRRVDRLMPYSNARLPDGSRVNVVIPPASEQGPVISIRRFARESLSIEDLINAGSLNKAMAKLLTAAIRSRMNVMIIGGAGAGKTTLLNAIAHEIGFDERIVTIEDVRELRIEHPHLVNLEAQRESLEGLGEITMRDLFINALRMRPTRIIIGEVRGLEILEMLQAMNSGHDGSLTTLHASSPEDVPARILNMVALAGVAVPSDAILKQVVNNIDLIVEVQHLNTGQRFIRRICECLPDNEGNFSLHDIINYSSHRLYKSKPKVEYKHHIVSEHFKTRVEEYGLAKLLEENGHG